MINSLLEALKDEITEAVKDFRLPTKDGELRNPDVYINDLPPGLSGGALLEKFPFVIVRANNGKANRVEVGAETTVVIIIGTYSKNLDSSSDCINVMERIQQALFTLPDDTLAETYIMQENIDWTLHNEDYSPQSQIDMYTTWEHGTAQVVCKYE
ncbi:MAG: hypothetical protein IKA32_11945 [Lentisphaeria bacterium]|nr:hypothetical protein [Lentisphaeria bacterium]